MVEKSGKPEKSNNGVNKKPESGRAFIFGRKKEKTDSFIGDGSFSMDGQTDQMNTNSFFTDDKANKAKKNVEQEKTQEVKDTALMQKTGNGKTENSAAEKDEKTRESAEKKQEASINEEHKREHDKNTSGIEKKEKSTSKETDKKEKKSGNKDKQKRKVVSEPVSIEAKQQPEKVEISAVDINGEKVKVKNEKKGFFSKVSDLKDKDTEKEEPGKQKAEKNKKKSVKPEKSIVAKKTTGIKNVDEELEAIKKQQKKAARKIGRRLSNPVSAVFTWIKGIIPSKGRDNALKFAQTAGWKKTKKTKRIFIYSGAGVLAVATLLVFIFMPFGANSDLKEDAVDEPDSVDMVSALTEQTSTPIPTKTVIPTTSVTQTPIVTTEPDPTHQTINVSSMIDDCMVDADIYYNEVGYSNNYYEYTENEMYILAQLIHGEARGESLDGMVAVGNVVMNRVLNRRYFGNTIQSVVTASGQFSGYKPTIVPSSKCKIAARKVLDYQVWVVPQNIYYFKASGVVGVDWGSHKFYKRIGGHNFYIHRYGGRSNTDKIPPRMYERTYKWPRMGCWPEDRIYRVQYMLNKLGYDVKADSYFGAGTMKELKKFQEKKGLEADGVAGPSTIEALIRAFGVEEYYEKFYT